MAPEGLRPTIRTVVFYALQGLPFSAVFLIEGMTLAKQPPVETLTSFCAKPGDNIGGSGLKNKGGVLRPSTHILGGGNDLPPTPEDLFQVREDCAGLVLAGPRQIPATISAKAANLTERAIQEYLSGLPVLLSRWDRLTCRVYASSRAYRHTLSCI